MYLKYTEILLTFKTVELHHIFKYNRNLPSEMSSI